MKEKAVIAFMVNANKAPIELEIPLDITANDLIIALNTAYHLGFNTSKIQDCYLKSESPIALLKGNRTLREIGITDGSVVRFDKRAINN